MRFLHQLFARHLQQETDTKNWCIFTRTCAALLRLHTDDKLKQLITHSVQQKMDSVRIVALNSTISSTTECDKVISEFEQDPALKILIAVADMKRCTAAQVNYFRNAVNTCDITKVIIVILHFPPEMTVLSRPCYHAVFLNKWDFICILIYTGSSQRGY